MNPPTAASEVDLTWGRPTIPKVALLSGSYWPVEGGAERQLRQVFQEPTFRRQFRTRVLTTGVPGLPSAEMAADHEIVRIGARGLVSARDRRHVALNLLWSLAKYRPDVIVSSQVGLMTAVGTVAALAQRVPLVVRLASGGVSRNSGQLTFAPLAESSRHWRLIRVGIQMPRSRIVVPAQHMASLVTGLHPEFSGRVVHIPNGVTRSSNEPALIVDKDVLWYGREDWIKNIGAFRQVASSAPSWSFTAIGPVSEESALPANVERIGWTPNPEQYIRRSRCTLITSYYEGSPNFALQSLSLGVPVVGFAIDALKELSAEYPGMVYLVPVDDVFALRAAVLEAITGSASRYCAEIPTIADVSVMWSRLLTSLIAEPAAQ